MQLGSNKHSPVMDTLWYPPTLTSCFGFMMKLPRVTFSLPFLSVSSLERNYFMHFCSNPFCHCHCSHLFISRYQVVFFQIPLTWTLGLLSKLEVWWSPWHLSTEPNVFGLRAKLFGWLLVLDEVWSQWALSTKQHWKLVWLGSIFRDSNRILSPSVILD